MGREDGSFCSANFSLLIGPLPDKLSWLPILLVRDGFDQQTEVCWTFFWPFAANAHTNTTRRRYSFLIVLVSFCLRDLPAFVLTDETSVLIGCFGRERK